MDLSKELKEAADKKVKVLDQIQQLKQQEQVLLQELLMIEGEIRLLQRLGNKNAGQTENKDAKIEESKDAKS